MIRDYNKLITIDFSSNANGKEAIFIIENELSVNNVEYLMSEIQNNIEKCNSFYFQLKEIENIDVAAIQLLHSFKRKAAELKKNIRYEIELSDNAKKILLYAGLTEYTTNNN